VQVFNEGYRVTYELCLQQTFSQLCAGFLYISVGFPPKNCERIRAMITFPSATSTEAGK